MASDGGKSRPVAGRALIGQQTTSPSSAGDGSDGSTTTTVTDTAAETHDVPKSDGFTEPDELDAGSDHVELSIAEAAAATETVTGSHVLRIDGFSATKDLAVGDYIESGAFRVGGHAWSVLCYPCGDEEESAGWVCLFLQLVDDNVAAASAMDAGGVIKAECVFTLMDFAAGGVGELAPSIRIKPHVFSAADKSRGCDFIERKELEMEPSRLVNNCFRVRCDVILVNDDDDEKSPSPMPPPPPLTELHRHLGDLLASQVGKDVTFEVAGELVTAHRCVLAARSPVFMAELFGTDEKEEDKEDVAARHVVQVVGDMEPEVFKALLHFVYTDSLPEICDDGDGGNKVKMVQRLVVAADRYDMKRLKVICEDILYKYINATTAATTLLLAAKHGCHRLKEACVAFLKDLLASVEAPGDQTCSLSSPARKKHRSRFLLPEQPRKKNEVAFL
ncbi:hypothetical protein EJB05_23123, partial [Eragrostis curvula]